MVKCQGARLLWGTFQPDYTPALSNSEKTCEAGLCLYWGWGGGSTITYLSWQNEALLADFEWVKISISIQVGNLGEFQ